MKFSITSALHSRKGFTLIEMLIFSAISSLVMIAFISMLVVVTRIQVRQSAAAEVNQQSQFLLQKVQQYVEMASFIDNNPKDVATTTLKLWMPSSTSGNTPLVYIFLSSSTTPNHIGKVYVSTSSPNPAVAQALTSDRVDVTSLYFTKRANPGGHDSVSITFGLQYATQNLQQRFAESLQTAVARAGTAYFDSDMMPAIGNYKLGDGTSNWSPINGVLYFPVGGNVGVGAMSPTAKLQVDGGDLYIDDPSYGVLLKDSSGNVCWRIKVTAVTGALTTTSSTCP
jgi:Tfp pilus assembly protein PilW